MTHHPAKLFCGFEQGHTIPAAAQLTGGRQTGGAAADDGDGLRALNGWGREGPALGQRIVADESFPAANADGFVQFNPATSSFARMVADVTGDGASVYRGDPMRSCPGQILRRSCAGRAELTTIDAPSQARSGKAVSSRLSSKHSSA
ncbi:MAG: hypothetical protein P1U75_13975 [Antarcticimicrobium sp.]|uniref:hypothetical protein n=1 Tax=Antarcticimicrobium sp. TaxID=2824147 RepID=UPI0026197E8E|nr:hypothetical protein [Antarcticimicrobium sp.]MDF1717763.1 hypothetical protein [Antarcticimicrobium sp.]